MHRIRTFFVIACTIAIVVIAVQLTYSSLSGPRSTASTSGVVSFPDQRISYNLVDDRGQPWTPQLLQGHPSLVYFGYTNCPDVCPTTLFEMAGWFKTLGSQGDGLKAYFFSVDPQRDTASMMHTYISNFTDRITGVTGAAAEMQKAIQAWRIYAQKVPAPDGGDNYTMDHTASVMMVDRDGQLKGMISYGEDPAVASKKIENLLKP